MATTNRFRVGGSGFTVIHWRGQPLQFARQVSHSSPPPVGPGATPIQPLDAGNPLEIITPAAISMGTLVLELYETYGRKTWDALFPGARGTLHDLRDVFLHVANLGQEIQVTKVVRPPRGANVRRYAETYHQCVIGNIQDGEQIETGTMEVLKQITVNYTKVTRN